jgi:hypothetical protein
MKVLAVHYSMGGLWVDYGVTSGALSGGLAAQPLDQHPRPRYRGQESTISITRPIASAPTRSSCLSGGMACGPRWRRTPGTSPRARSRLPSSTWEKAEKTDRQADPKQNQDRGHGERYRFRRVPATPCIA